MISLNEKIVKVKSDNYSLTELEANKLKAENSLIQLISQRDVTQSKIQTLEEAHIQLEEEIDSFDEDLITKE